MPTHQHWHMESMASIAHSSLISVHWTYIGSSQSSSIRWPVLNSSSMVENDHRCSIGSTSTYCNNHMDCRGWIAVQSSAAVPTDTPSTRKKILRDKEADFTVHVKNRRRQTSCNDEASGSVDLFSIFIVNVGGVLALHVEIHGATSFSRFVGEGGVIDDDLCSRLRCSSSCSCWCWMMSSRRLSKSRRLTQQFMVASFFDHFTLPVITNIGSTLNLPIRSFHLRSPTQWSASHLARTESDVWPKHRSCHQDTSWWI